MSTYDQAVSGAYTRKRQADSLEELRESVAEIRRCERRRSAWLRAKEVEWWDDKARQVQDKADQGDAFGGFSTFKELRNRGLSFALGEVRPADVQSERDAWAEHFRLIGEGSGWWLIRFGIMCPPTPPWMLFGEQPPPPTNFMQLFGRCP